MTRFFKPQHGELLRTENIVIGHLDDMTIVKNEKGMLYYVDSDSFQSPVGTVLENQALTPISRLNSDLQKKIQKFAKSLGV